jgi:hypothetical protein
MGIIHLNFTATPLVMLFNDAVSTAVTQRRIKWNEEILEDATNFEVLCWHRRLIRFHISLTFALRGRITIKNHFQ